VGRLLLIAFLSVALVGSAAGGPFASTLLAPPEDPQKAGLDAMDKGDFQTAVQVFTKALAADPQDYSAAFNLALAETQLHQDEKAIADFQKTLTLKPNLYEAELNLGILYLRNKRPAEAVPLLQDAAKQRTSDARSRRYLGDALLAQSDFLNAATQYQDALRLDPKAGPAELGLGQSLERQGKLDEALPHYQKAAALDPQFKSYLLQLAQSYAAAKRNDEAVALLRNFESEPAVREELGRLYLQSNRPEEAVNAFKAAVAQSPTSANQLALATAYLRNNQPALAAPILESALSASPNDYDLRMAVGRIRRDQHEYPAAADQFLLATRLKPDSVEAWNETASVLVLGDRYPEALAALDKIRSLKAETAGNFYYRAICLDKLHQKKLAIENYHRFLDLSAGKFPDQEFNARQRARTLEHEVNR
jgi:tetratricopeptide (TPR) repeat protein